jgi:hypothetical protein
MKKFTVLIAVFCIVVTVQAQTFSWAKFFSGTNTNYITDVATDASGNIYCTGYFFETLQLGTTTLSAPSGNAAGFVMKTAADGTPQWVVPLNSPYINSMAIAVAPDGSVYAGGSFREKISWGSDSLISTTTNNAFLAKINNNGQMIWMKNFGGNPADFGYNRMNIMDIALDYTGNIYYTGFFSSEISSGAITLNSSGTNDAFYGKTNPSGNTLWIKKCGGTYSGSCGLPNNDCGNSICLDASGNIFLAGHFAFNFTIGTLTAPGMNDIEAFYAKLDNSGNPIWVKSVAGPGVQSATSAATDPGGNLVLAMRFQLECYIGSDTLVSYSLSGSPYDMAIIKADGNSNLIWYRQEGFTSGGDYPEALRCDNASNIYVCGKFTGSTQIGDTTLSAAPSWADRIFLVSYNASGQTNFVLQCGGERNYPNAMTLNQQNNIILAGSADIGSSSGIHFGSFSCPGSYGHYPYIAGFANPVSSLNYTAEKEGILIFPNPAEDRITITSDREIRRIEIFDLKGSLVWSDLHVRGKNLTFSPGILPGYYFLRVSGENSVSEHPLMIIRK